MAKFDELGNLMSDSSGAVSDLKTIDISLNGTPIIQDGKIVNNGDNYMRKATDIRNSISNKISNALRNISPRMIWLPGKYNNAQLKFLKDRNACISYEYNQSLKNNRPFDINSLRDEAKIALAYLLIHAKCFHIDTLSEEQVHTFLNKQSEEAITYVNSLT